MASVTGNTFTVSPIRGKGRKRNYVEERAFKNVTLEKARFRLFFNDNSEEKKFRSHVYIKSRRIIRIIIVVLILVSIVSNLLDIFIFHYDSMHKMYIFESMIPTVIQIIISSLWLAFTFRTERRARNDAIDSWYEQQKCFLLKSEYWKVACCSATIIAMCKLYQTISSSQEPDHGVYMLFYFIIYLFVGIPFFFAFLITWTTYLIFLISMFYLSWTQSDYLLEGFQLSAIYLFVTNILLTVAAYSLEMGERIEFVHEKDLKHQQHIIEGLLNNLLPNHVTDKMRNDPTSMIAEQVQECTILFSDMVSFTKWASTQEADVLIQRLHELYACFDDLCLLHRVYKVETIGDAYFVSSNCPIMAPDHADRCLTLGRNMMKECRKLDWRGYSPRMRIGIHTGPVMAGVVGRKMPRYHLFGGTVLIAEELESSGKPECLHISETTKNCITNPLDWKLEDRGPKEVLHGSKVFHTYLVDLTEFLQSE